MRGDIDDLHVVGDNIFLQTLLHCFGKAGFEIEEDFVFQNVDVEVGLHFALGRDDRGVAALTHFQILHVVRDLAVQEILPIRPEQAESPAKTKIEHAGGVFQSDVFCKPLAVMRHDFRVVDFGKLCVQAVVQFVQGKRTHSIWN